MVLVKKLSKILLGFGVFGHTFFHEDFFAEKNCLKLPASFSDRFYSIDNSFLGVLKKFCSCCVRFCHLGMLPRVIFVNSDINSNQQFENFFLFSEF